MTLDQVQARVDNARELVARVRQEISKVIVGQATLVERLLLGLFTKGHILLEGVPGLAKTTAVKALAACLEAEFKRVQFTPDLLPADLVGTEVYEPSTGQFRVRRGPLFHNIILADEINRAPSKVQSALLEAMQELQVTVGGETFFLPDPFLVLATQNPIEQEGTYPLPEAQVDRFMLKLVVDYPDKEEEKEIVRRMGSGAPPLPSPVMTPSDLAAVRGVIGEIHMDERLLEYVVDVVFATRNPQVYGVDAAGYIQFGASPRASLYLTLAARAHAFLDGRAYVTPQDVKIMGPDILRHRIILTYEAEAEEVTTEEIIDRVFQAVEVP